MGVNDLEKSDEEIAQANREDSSFLEALDDIQFNALLTLETHEGYEAVEPFGQILYLVQTKGLTTALNWIKNLPSYGT